MTTNLCEQCRIRDLREEGPAEPNWKEQPKALLLLDYPSLEDFELKKVASGLGSRIQAIHRLLKENKISADIISYATVIRCLTKSKAVLTYQDYKHCGQMIIEEIEKKKIPAVMCFGSVPSRLLLGREAEAIDKFRGKVHNLYNGVTCVVATYALSLMTEKSCSGCGRTLWPHLMSKDMGLFKSVLIEKGVIK